MSITNYDELKKKFESWIHRDDLGVEFDTFLQLAEVEMRSNPDEPLMLLSLETISESTLLTTTRFLGLPDGITKQSSLKIIIEGYNYELDYVSPENMKSNDDVSGVPTQYTISNNSIEFNRVPDKAYTVSILYSLTDTPLTSVNQTNAVLAKYPNIYLYGTLAQGFSFVQDTEQESKYSQYFLQSIIQANRAEKRIKYPNGLTVRSPRVV